jgi:hypothetical protein
VKSGEICVGLHATVTCEWEWPLWGPVLPAEDVPSLVDERGALHRTPSALHESGAAPGQVLSEAIAEVAAQLARLRSLGLDVKYMDEHMGFAWLDGMDAALQELAEREGLVRKPPVDGLEWPEPGPDPRDHASRLLAAVACAGPGTYLVVGHPAFDDDEMARVHGSAELAEVGAGMAAGDVGPDRDGQRMMFMRADVVSFCRETGVELLRYDEL